MMMSAGKPLASQVNPFRNDGKVERSTKSSADGINSGQEKRPQLDPRKFYLEGYGLPKGRRYGRHGRDNFKVASVKIEYGEIELGLNTRAIQLARLPRVDAQGNNPLVTLLLGMKLDEEKEGNPATPSPVKASNVAAKKGLLIQIRSTYMSLREMGNSYQATAHLLLQVMTHHHHHEYGSQDDLRPRMS